MNGAQKNTIEELKKVLPRAHFVDIVVRIDGEDRKFQADWLLELLDQTDIRKVVEVIGRGKTEDGADSISVRVNT